MQPNQRSGRAAFAPRGDQDLSVEVGAATKAFSFVDGKRERTSQ